MGRYSQSNASDSRTCSRCGVEKHISEFHSRGNGRRRASCKKCYCSQLFEKRRSDPDTHRKASNRYYHAHRKRCLEIRSKNRRLKWYGLTIEEWERLLCLQKNKCAICEEQLQPGKTTQVDHCHKTKKIRGILCFNCNILLGMAHDNPNILRLATSYLEKHRPSGAA